MTSMTATDEFARALRVDALADDVADVKADVRQIRGGVDELRSALAVLVRHEVRMETHTTDFGKLRDHVDSMDTRLHLVEQKMPALEETRGWVVRALIAVVGTVLLAVVALVVKVT